MENIGMKLAEIERESLIEHRLRDLLQDWRMFIKQAKTHLPRIRQHLQDFAHTLYYDPDDKRQDTVTYTYPRTPLPDHAELAVRSLMGQLQEMTERCEKTEQSLRTESRSLIADVVSQKQNQYRN